MDDLNPQYKYPQCHDLLVEIIRLRREINEMKESIIKNSAKTLHSFSSNGDGEANEHDKNDTNPPSNKRMRLNENFDDHCQLQKNIGGVDVQVPGQAESRFKYFSNCFNNFINDSSKDNLPEFKNIISTPSPRNPESPFENRLIILEILKKLPRKQFLNCRLLNSLWNDLAITTIISQSRIGNRWLLKFRFSESTKCYKMQKKRASLKKFVYCFQKCPKFPFRIFRFDGGSLDSSNMRKFLSHFGPHILKLTLDFTPCTQLDLHPHRTLSSYPKIRTIRRILLESVPNLCILQLEGSPSQWEDENSQTNLFPEPFGLIRLPHLKVLKLDDMNSPVIFLNIIRDILRVAENLETILGIDFGRLPTIISTNKMHAIRDFAFNPLPDDLQLCNRLISVCPELQSMDFWFGDICQRAELWPQFGKALTKILIICRQSLRKIEYFHPTSFLTNFKIPRLPNVKQIVFSDMLIYYSSASSIRDHRMLPRSENGPARLIDIFEGLTKIKFYVDVHDDESLEVWESLYENCKPLGWVKILEFSDTTGQSLSWFDKLFVLFPHITQFKICIEDVRDCRKFCRGIWQCFPRLKIIWMSIKLGHYENEFCSKMDSAITGFSRANCADLKFNSREVTIEQANELREKPSILDLTSLSSFTMEFEITEDFWVVNDFHVPIFSYVSGIYGFQILKERQGTTIRCRNHPNNSSQQKKGLEKTLDLILPYIDEL